MKKISIITFALAIAALPMLAGDEKTQSFAFDAAAIESLVLDHPVGELNIVDAPGDAITVTMTASCDGRHCADKLAEIRLESRTSGKTLKLEVAGYPHFGGNVNVDLEIRMPSRISIDADHGVGEVTIKGITSDISLDCGVGEVEIESAAAAFALASIDSGVGDADLQVAGDDIEPESSFVGSETHWNKGTGKHRIEIEVGVGSASVKLD